MTMQGNFRGADQAAAQERAERERLMNEHHARQFADLNNRPSGNLNTRGSSSSGANSSSEFSFSFSVCILTFLVSLGYFTQEYSMEIGGAAIISGVIGVALGALWKPLMKLIAFIAVATLIFFILMEVFK